jgi:hypothetical protein
VKNAALKAVPPPSAAPAAERPRETEGWREGRPVEDPDKLKRWGFVTAKPSEFLVHVRGGRVLTGSSGQGASCFKWPWDAVSVIPTSLQRLQFRADQVTAEKVGVEVMGLAVYRIAEPLLAFRVLNFSYPERAQEKLEETLSGMFVGAVRRLVANLTLEDCLQKRKSALGEELLREIAPVVGGRGAPEDSTEAGWGVVIDTIEIQEVRVLSEKVFSAMQAPFRTQLDLRAREARSQADQQASAGESECRRQIEEARIRTDSALREMREAAARAELEAATQAHVRASELAATEAQADLAAKAQLEKSRSDERLRTLHQAQVEAKAELEVYEVRRTAAQAQAQLTRDELALEMETRRARSELAHAEGLAKAEVETRGAEVQRLLAEAAARRITAEKLPQLAEALGEKIAEVRIVQMGGAEANPFSSITQALGAVLELARK